MLSGRAATSCSPCVEWAGLCSSAAWLAGLHAWLELTEGGLSRLLGQSLPGLKQLQLRLSVTASRLLAGSGKVWQVVGLGLYWVVPVLWIRSRDVVLYYGGILACVTLWIYPYCGEPWPVVTWSSPGCSSPLSQGEERSTPVISATVQSGKNWSLMPKVACN